MSRYYLTQNESTTRFYIDKVSGLETDLPTMDYRLLDGIGDGGTVKGSGIRKGRQISFSYFFTRNNESDRDDFLSWFSKGREEVLYFHKEIDQRLYANITSGSTICNSTYVSILSSGISISGVGLQDNTIIDSIGSSYFLINQAASLSINNAELTAITFDGRLQIYAQPEGGESYENIRISKDLKFNCISGEPFFTSTSSKTATIILTGTSQHTTSIYIYGYKTPCIYTFQTSSNFNTFVIKTAESYGFRVDYSFGSTDLILIDTRNSDLQATLNNNNIYGYFYYTSTPFFLNPGSNTLYINAAAGTLTVSYYERRL